MIMRFGRSSIAKTYFDFFKITDISLFSLLTGFLFSSTIFLIITSSAQSYPNDSIRITYYIVISIIMSLLHQSFYHCYINHLIWDFSPSNQSLFYSSPVNEIITTQLDQKIRECILVIRFYYHFRRCQQNIFRVRESIFLKTYLLIIYR